MCIYVFISIDYVITFTICMLWIFPWKWYSMSAALNQRKLHTTNSEKKTSITRIIPISTAVVGAMCNIFFSLCLPIALRLLFQICVLFLYLHFFCFCPNCISFFFAVFRPALLYTLINQFNRISYSFTFFFCCVPSSLFVFERTRFGCWRVLRNWNKTRNNSVILLLMPFNLMHTHYTHNTHRKNVYAL